MISKNKIDDYEDVHASHQRYFSMDGSQIGDPEKAADVFIQLAEQENPPVRLFMGSDAVARAEQKIKSLSENLQQWKDLSFRTDF